MAKPPSPCIDVCKFTLDGHCIGCGMTKKQRKRFKDLDGGGARRAFILSLLDQQRALGRPFTGWARAYRKRCARKDRPCVLDEMRA